MGYLKILNLYRDQTILLFKEVFCLEKIHGCLHADSLVNLANGTLKPIQKIEKGDIVKSYDQKSKSFINSKVQATIAQDITEKLDWHLLVFENNKQMICTEDHPILTTQGWVLAKDLTVNHDVINIMKAS